MMIRPLYNRDVKQLKIIHQQYDNEFEFKEFDDPHFLQLLAVIDKDSNNIICAGGVRTLTEAVLITDKQSTVRRRKEALHKFLEACELVCKQNGYSELNAFIQDKVWLQHLLDNGFRRPKGEAVVLSL